MKNLLRNLCFALWSVAALAVIVHSAGKPAAADAAAFSVGNIAIVGGQWVITTSGDVYVAGSINQPTWMKQYDLSPVPIPPSEIAMIGEGGCGGLLLVDRSGSAWVYCDSSWRNIGSPPGGAPIAVTPQTWSQIKGQYAPKTGGGQ